MNKVVDLNKAKKIKTLDNAYLYKGKVIYIKTSVFPYAEIIAEEIGKFLGLNVLHYKIGSLNNKIVAFSEKFYKDNETYISGDELLSNYCAFAGQRDITNPNNLTNIWDALETKYGLEYASDIRELMNNIVKMFCFDLLLGLDDRASINWGIIQSENKIRLAPIFDNEFIKLGGRTMLDLDDDIIVYNTEKLAEFLNTSSSEFNDIFYEMFAKLTPPALADIMAKISFSRDIIIPENIRLIILRDYQNYYQELEEIVEESKERKYSQ